MKRDHEQEEDLAELLQFLDDESEGTSNDGDDDREPELEPKHKIFLSHSGVQKNFTEQLCKDLEGCHYYPFFDKRPDSLPKGKKFPELIFQAARQCQVAVLILSEDFFTGSKWPMLELEAFVQSQIKNPQKVTILPVYLGLSRNECTKNEIRRDGWVSMWQEWAKKDESIVVGEWKDALRVLGPSNGIEYVQASGEVALREQIVSAIRGLVPPEKQWSDANVQGRPRIRRALMKKFMRTKPSPLYGVRVVGIHGTGGIGKTTFCKVLCDELNVKFEGKVFPAELGSKSEIELQKEVLRDLTDANHDILTSATIGTTTNLLERRIRQQRVFLALDNVWQESIEEAKIYLRAGFHHGSIVMVTARSIDILGRMNIDISDCMEMPELEKEDAKCLFLHHVGFGHQLWTEDDEQKIEYCVRQCQFRKGENMGEHFHPLALKVLGSQLGSLGRDPSVWVESLSSDDKFNQFRQKEHPIFSILRRGYDLLCEEDQLLFMDCILFNPYQIFPLDRWVPPFYLVERPANFQVNIYEWLSIVHQSEARVIMDRLKGLKARSLIEGVGDGFRGVTVHDLYREFAELEAKKGALDSRRWVWYHKEAPYPSDLVKRPSGNCWPNVERVLVVYDDCSEPSNVRWMGTFKGVKWQHFSNVVVLQLLIGTNEVLDLQGLQCLRSLELRWAGFIEGGGELLGLGELRNLGLLELCNIHYAPCFEEIGDLTRLEVLHLNTSCVLDNCDKCPFPAPLERLNLDKCIQLRDLVLECTCLEELPDLSSLTSLRRVLFRSCVRAREVVGLSSQMSSLQELGLIQCSSLSQCHGLGDLVSLQELDIKWCDEFVQLPDLHKLTTLRRLKIIGCGIEVAQGFNDSMQLQELDVYGVKELVDSHLLRHLRHLCIGSDLTIQHMMLWSGSFVALEELILLKLLRGVQDLPGIEKLTRLRRLDVHDAPHLLQLPRVGDLVALECLRLTDCCTEVGAAKLPDLHNLTNLEILNLSGTPIESLPGLEHLTRLRDLNCINTRLAALPDLSALHKLPNLGGLDINDFGIEVAQGFKSLRDLMQLQEFVVKGVVRGVKKLVDFFRM